jgi:hypothetical protein
VGERKKGSILEDAELSLNLEDHGMIYWLADARINLLIIRSQGEIKHNRALEGRCDLREKFIFNVLYIPHVISMGRLDLEQIVNTNNPSNQYFIFISSCNTYLSWCRAVAFQTQDNFE